jgi:hypothetical protein
MFYITRIKEFGKITNLNLELPISKPLSNVYERGKSV